MTTNVTEVKPNIITIRVGKPPKDDYPTYIFHITAILPRATSVIKPAIKEAISKLIKNKYNVIFWHSLKCVNIQDVDNGTVGKYITQLKQLFIEKFTVVYSTTILSAPYIDSFITVVRGPINIVGTNVGNCTITQGTKQITTSGSDIDYSLYRNFLINKYDATFIYTEQFVSPVEDFLIESHAKFDPCEFLEYKKDMYPQYLPSLELLVNNTKDKNSLYGEHEIIYIAGAPSMGKTRFACYIAQEWDYVYVSNLKNIDKLRNQYRQKKLDKSFVVDVNPINNSNYEFVPSRIFIIQEENSNSAMRYEISRHMNLCRKRLLNKNNLPCGTFDTRDVTSYFQVNDRLRYPNVHVEYLDFIPHFVDTDTIRAYMYYHECETIHF